MGSPSDISEIEALNVEIKEADVRIVPNLMHTFLNGMQRIVVSIANVDRNIIVGNNDKEHNMRMCLNLDKKVRYLTS